LKREIPIKNLYFLLSYAWDSLVYSEDKLLGNDNFSNASNLMSKMLELSFSHLVKRGLEKRYTSFNNEIFGIKGKLCFSDTVKTSKLHNGKTICEFDEFGFDNDNNRIHCCPVRGIA